MFSHPVQKKAYDACAAALSFAIDPAKITVEPGVSYLPSPIKLHDYAAGVMAAFGSVVEYIGCLRGLPSQTMTLNRRLCGFHINELQVQLRGLDDIFIAHGDFADDTTVARPVMGLSSSR